MPKGNRSRAMTEVVCEGCGGKFMCESRAVREKNYCGKKCNPRYTTGDGNSMTLVHAVVDGENDPIPQLGCKLTEREWIECQLPNGCVLKDRAGKLYITSGASINPLPAGDYIRDHGPARTFCGGAVYSTGTAWHDKRMTCPGVAWEV